MSSPSLGAVLGSADLTVSAVVPGSLADRAGVQVGDRLLTVGGSLVATTSDLRAELERLAVGDEVQLQVARAGQVTQLQATLGPPPAPVLTLGARLRPGTVQVSGVVADGLAAACGLVAGDVLLRVNGTLVASAADVRSALERAEVGERVGVQVKRADTILALDTVVAEVMLREPAASGAAESTAVPAAQVGAAVPPGWYPSPAGDGRQAYWTGSTWQMPDAIAPGAVRGYAYPQTSGLAVAALVCAFVAPFILPIVLGMFARNDIRRSNGMKTGSGMATAAIVLGWIFTVLIVLWVVGVMLAISSSRRY